MQVDVLAHANDPGASQAPDVVIVRGTADSDHFAGVSEALGRCGLRSAVLNEYNARGIAGFGPPHSGMPSAPSVPGAVLVKDCESPLSLWALRRAREIGCRAVLLMDGVLEYRNTFKNPFTPPGFLRPAPVDLVCCAGEADRQLLESWGNRVVATGLPRIGSSASVYGSLSSPQPEIRVPQLLIATARTPAFNADEWMRLVDALAEVRDACVALGVRGHWRLTAGLDVELGVNNDERSLMEAIAASDGVLSTPSTLALEAMLARRPVGLLHPHPGPLWQRAVWCWRRGQSSEGVLSARELILAVLRAHWGEIALQDGYVKCAHREGSAATHIAEAIAELLDAPRARAVRPLTALPSIAQLPERVPPITGRVRVVNVVSCDDTPIGGILTWALRLAREFARRAASDDRQAYDVRTLVVASRPEGLKQQTRGRTFDLNPDGLTSICVLDPMCDPHERVAMIRAAIERVIGWHDDAESDAQGWVAESIVLPNFHDAVFMAATQLRAAAFQRFKRGLVRIVTTSHADSPYYRELLKAYPRFDACAAVNSNCMKWARQIEAETRGNWDHARPVERIVCGVPSMPESTLVERLRVSTTRSRDRAVGRTRPLRLAYVGRMVEEQKRISLLIDLLAELERLGVPSRLDMVGDGPDLASWARKAKVASASWKNASWCILGRRDPSWITDQLAGGTWDASVLVSDYEGTSVTMLEAMAAGVPPIVTDCGSGIADVLRDGANAIVVPRDRVVDIAQRIVSLARTSEGVLGALERLGRESHRTITELGLTIDATADQYAALFDRARATHFDSTPSDSGLHPTEAWRWTKTWCDHPAEAKRWCADRLMEAGFTQIAPALSYKVDVPGEMERAVLFGNECFPTPTRLPPSREEVDQLRRRGVGVAVTPMLQEDGVMRRVIELVHRAVEDVTASGRKPRVSVYGVGRHTHRIADIFAPEVWSLLRVPYPFVAFLDDRAERGDSLFGLPVVRLGDAAALDTHAVLLSSDAFEAMMWANCAELRRNGVRVLPIYGRFADRAERECERGDVPASHAVSTPDPEVRLGAPAAT